MTAKIIYQGNLRTQAIHLSSGNEIITDAPKDNQGNGEAFSPTDLVAASLGSCMLTIMGIYARNHQLNIDGTKIEITKIMGESPRRIIEIIADIFITNAALLSEANKKALEHAALNCPVAKSLNTDIVQKVVFHYR
jgi:putative redox protein